MPPCPVQSGEYTVTSSHPPDTLAYCSIVKYLMFAMSQSSPSVSHSTLSGPAPPLLSSQTSPTSSSTLIHLPAACPLLYRSPLPVSGCAPSYNVCGSL